MRITAATAAPTAPIFEPRSLTAPPLAAPVAAEEVEEGATAPAEIESQQLLITWMRIRGDLPDGVAPEVVEAIMLDAPEAALEGMPDATDAALEAILDALIEALLAAELAAELAPDAPAPLGQLAADGRVTLTVSHSCCAAWRVTALQFVLALQLLCALYLFSNTHFAGRTVSTTSPRNRKSR